MGGATTASKKVTAVKLIIRITGNAIARLIILLRLDLGLVAHSRMYTRLDAIPILSSHFYIPPKP